MPRQFYTEKDIEDLFQSGATSLQVTEEVVLTELAYEKAMRLGLQLITDSPDNPPAAPVRPYLSNGQTAHTQPGKVSASQAGSSPASGAPQRATEREKEIEQRIRAAVIARLGDQVDAKLLDNIIHRVVKSTGLK